MGILAHCLNDEELITEREGEEEEEIKETEEEIEGEEEGERAELERLRESMQNPNTTRVLQQTPNKPLITKQNVSSPHIPERNLTEFEIPDKFKTAGEKLVLENETLQERLNERRDAEDEMKETGDDHLDEEEDQSPQEEKTQEELEIEIMQELTEKGDFSKTFVMNDPDMPNSFEFLNVDNDYFNDDCRLALENGKSKAIREQCLVYCHKYNIWFFSDSIYQDITKMGRIFNKVKRFLIDELDIDAKDIPEKVDMNENDMFPSNHSEMDIFSRFNYYFSGQGVMRNSLIEWEA